MSILDKIPEKYIPAVFQRILDDISSKFSSTDKQIKSLRDDSNQLSSQITALSKDEGQPEGYVLPSPQNLVLKSIYGKNIYCSVDPVSNEDFPAFLCFEWHISTTPNFAISRTTRFKITRSNEATYHGVLVKNSIYYVKVIGIGWKKGRRSPTSAEKSIFIGVFPPANIAVEVRKKFWLFTHPYVSTKIIWDQYIGKADYSLPVKDYEVKIVPLNTGNTGEEAYD